MVKYAWVEMVLVILLVLLLSFLRVLDSTIEIDDLKTNAGSQKTAFIFLGAITNRSLAKCSLKVSDLEEMVSSTEWAQIHWTGDLGSAGFFQARPT